MVEDGGKPVIMVAVDDSSHSNYALEWTLDYFCAPFAPNYPFTIMLIHARPSLIQFAVAGPGSPGTVSISVQEIERKKKAQKVIDNAIEICSKRSVNDVAVQVMDGDPRNVMTEAVDKFHPAFWSSEVVVMEPSKVLGSVSDYCAHHCSITVPVL